MLELRMEQHYAHVDYMVLAESRLTFSGKSKPLYFQENKARFRRFSDKIIHVVIEDDIKSKNAWKREKFQRNAIARGLTDANKSDVVLLSDLDEILRESAIGNLRRNSLKRGEVRCFELRWYQHYFNLQLPSMWLRNGPRAAKWADVPDLTSLRAVKGPTDKRLQDLARRFMATLSMRRPIQRSIERDAGWHFSWLGGEESVAAKLAAIPAQVGMHEGLSIDPSQMIPNLDSIKASPHQFSIVCIDESFPDFIFSKTPFITQHSLPFDT